jgi:hypothetical protein
VDPDQLTDLRRHADDCDRRLLGLEAKAEFQSGELASLRSSRHEYGNLLQTHTLEIRSIQQSLSEVHLRRIHDIEKAQLDMKIIMTKLGEALGAVISDQKVLAWKVGAIIGLIVFAATQVASYIHF